LPQSLFTRSSIGLHSGWRFAAGKKEVNKKGDSEMIDPAIDFALTLVTFLGLVSAIVNSVKLAARG
jgi:hypothetical protein